MQALDCPVFYYGGRSSVGRAPGCGLGRRGFESLRPPFWRPPPRSRKPLSDKDLGGQSYFNYFVIFTEFLLTNVPIYIIIEERNNEPCGRYGISLVTR